MLCISEIHSAVRSRVEQIHNIYHEPRNTDGTILCACTNKISPTQGTVSDKYNIINTRMIPMKTLMIVDGNSIINRAFYAIKALANKSGMFTNGIYGFLNILFKNMDTLNPDYIAVTFDLKAPTFRHIKYPLYKAQRKKMPTELAMQMPVLKEILHAMNITILEKEGYEADDIIGTVSRICDENGVECRIITGDKDDLQLASDTTKVMLTVTRMGKTETTEFDAAAVKEKYGVTPAEFIDVKGLMGDSSDNVPGVNGIGEKSAFALISEFGSIENLYKNLDSSSVKPAARKKLADGEDMAHLSKELCTIDRNVPIDFDIESTAVREYDNDTLAMLFKNLEFNAFLKRLNIGVKTDKQLIPDCAAVRIDSTDALAQIIQKAVADEKEVCYRIYAVGGAIYAFAIDNGGAVKIITADLLNTDSAIAAAIKPLFECTSVTKVTDRVKDDIVTLAAYGVAYAGPYFDIGVAAYIINPARTSYTADGVFLEFFGQEIGSEDELLGTGKSRKSYDAVDFSEFCEFVRKEVCALRIVKEYETEKIEQTGQTALLSDIELPLTAVLADMEIVGVRADRKKLSEFNAMLTEKIAVLEERIYSLAGEIFNINSTKQLGVILFEKLGLKVIKKTKTGYSTNSDVLEKLRGTHPIIDCIAEYRQLTKLKSTYADGLLAVIDDKTGRIHSKFNQTVTVTGRISSTEPNLQNIPVRTELGREIRKMFVAEDENHVLVDADYSQIELRIMAHMSGDENMCAAFRSNADIHTATAMNVFGVSADEVTPLLRTRAKAVNFGIIYGMGDFSLAQDLHITKREAKEYIDSYFDKHKKVREYLDNTVSEAKENGYVTTLFGRRRYIPELASTNHMVKAFGERVAMNTPIQGTAADIIKIAMVSVYRELKRQKLDARLILQVHDELIIESSKADEEKVKKLLEDCMENAAKLSVPLIAETHSGATWYEAK